MQPFSCTILKRIVVTSLCVAMSLTPLTHAVVIKDPEENTTVQTQIVEETSVDKVAVAATTDSIELDGASVQPEVYKIKNENYFKLRDIAYLMSDTDSKFNVEWDKESESILMSRGDSYITVGGEMSYAGGGNAVVSNAKLKLDGESINMTAYNIGGNNYFRLRDIGEHLGFAVDYDANESTVLMESGSEEVSRFTVTFEMNGHGTQIAPLTGIRNGSTIHSPSNAIVSGYALSGWFMDSDCTKVWDFTSHEVTKDVTLYAKWVNTYTVEFNMNGHGTQVDKIMDVPAGSLLTKPVPTESGYTFDGWYAEQGCYTPWDFAKDRVGSQVVLYAKWTQITQEKPDSNTPNSDINDNTSDTSGHTSAGRSDGILTILIDPGHGGADSGAFSVQEGVYEKHLCLNVALKLKAMLEATGVRVLMTRSTDETWAGSTRKVFVSDNADILDLVVCIHHNSGGGQGAEMLVPNSVQESSGESRKIASLFLSEYISLGLKNRGIKERPNLYMVKSASSAGVPIAYSEYCFLDSASDFSFVSTDAGLQNEAQAMYNAIMTYYTTVKY